MSNNYQAVYDAVRSRISNGDIGTAVENAFRDASLSHYIAVASQSISIAAASMQDPAVLYRPKVFLDGAKWCALYGENLMEGVAAFGDSPHEATAAFNTAWYAKANTQGD